jgi:hypothetical protein
MKIIFIKLEGELSEEIFERAFIYILFNTKSWDTKKSYIIFPMLEIGNHKKNWDPSRDYPPNLSSFNINYTIFINVWNF